MCYLARGEEPVIRGGVELCSSKLQAQTSEQSTEYNQYAGTSRRDAALCFIITIIILQALLRVVCGCVCTCMYMCVIGASPAGSAFLHAPPL